MIDRAKIAGGARWAVFAAYLALTFFLSGQEKVAAAAPIPDVALHAVEFSLLALLLLRALGGSLAGPHSWARLATVTFFGAAYGAFDELHQFVVPGRQAELKDALVDAAATVATVLGVAWYSRSAGRAHSPRARQPVGERTAASEDKARRRAGPRVEMLTRKGCHLCEEAGALLTEVLGPEGDAWRAIDISREAELAARFGAQIPVVFMDGVKRFKGRVDKGRLLRLLGKRAFLRARAEPGWASPVGKDDP